MAYRLKFAGRAVHEIGEAFDWYEEQSKGLGSEFELAFELQLKRLEQVPCCTQKLCRVYVARFCRGFRRVFFTRSKMIGFTFWLLFTMRAIHRGDPMSVTVNRPLHRTLCVSEFRRWAVS